MRQLLTPILVALLVGCASRDGSTADSRRDARDLLAFQPVDEPRSCVQTTRIRQTRVLSDQVIDFEMVGGGRLRISLPVPCPRLGFAERFSYRTTISQLCSGDIITVLQQPGLSAGPSCGLGQFQPVQPVER